MTLVAEASNGQEAILQFRADRPDVTLMDLQMPEMNGLDAMIAIRGATFRCYERSRRVLGFAMEKDRGGESMTAAVWRSGLSLRA